MSDFLSKIKKHKSAIIVAVITVACLVPFVNKAFNVDDPLFIWTAKHILTKPIDFYGFPVNWYTYEMSASEVIKNPPIASYYIALIAMLFGFKEIVLHTAFLIPAAAAAVGTYYLARKFCARPIQAALAAVLTPVFLVSSSSVMCDTMMMAFWVWAIFLWVRGIETDKYWDLFLAALLIAVCALTKYFGMALLVLLVVYSIIQKRKIGLWILFFLVPIAILAGYQLFTYKLYGRGLLSDAAAYAAEHGGLPSGWKILFDGFTGMIFIGGCAATVIFYSPLLWSKRVLIGGAVATILLMVILCFVGKLSKISVRNDDGIKWGFLIQACLMTVTGISILWLAGADFWKYKNAESLLLLLWVFGTFVFASFINWSINGRSFLPMIPAVGILMMRKIDQNRNNTRSQTKLLFLAWPLVCAAVLSLLVCLADYKWAGTARQAAERIYKTYISNGKKVWLQGHWGFQYYMEEKGGKSLDLKKPIIDHGDILVVPGNNTNVVALKTEQMFSLETFQLITNLKLVTMSFKAGAGFYADVWGPLPFVIGADNVERYSVFVFK